MKTLIITLALTFVSLLAFSQVKPVNKLQVHEYAYSYNQTTKGDHLKDANKENKAGYKLIGITYNSNKTVTFAYTNVSERYLINQLNKNYQIKM